MHPKYLGQVLLDRGIPQPPLRQLEVFVELLSEAERPLMEERLRKLALGAETQEDLEALLEGIRAHSPNAQRSEAEPVPPPARTEAEPTRKAKAAT